MKLKTKLVIIFCIILAVTIFMTDLLVYKLSADYMLNEALEAAYWESNGVFNGIKEYFSDITSKLSKSLVKYYLTSENDKYTVALKNGEEYYNHTVIPSDSLTEGKYVYHKNLLYKEEIINGNRVIIFKYNEKNVDFFRVINITPVYDRLDKLIIIMVSVSSLLLVMSAVTIFLLIQRTLLPLSELSGITRKIAEGAYGKRFSVKTKDEIGQLGTDFNNMAEAVEQHTKKLEESEQKKTLFMANLTHELKTPITAISGYARLLRTVKLSPKDRDDALTFIYEESNRLDRLSKKMMHIMGLEGNIQLEIKSHSLADIASAVTASCKPAADLKSIRLENHTEPVTVSCDFDLMCQLLINLLDNAIKACSDGGTVVLTSDTDSISVCDNGCGIPSDSLEKIFEPFYRVDKSRNSKKGGSGLGLAIVNEIAKLHKMRLAVSSELGKGTTVTLFFK